MKITIHHQGLLLAYYVAAHSTKMNQQNKMTAI
jgi:hypothetical protein